MTRRNRTKQEEIRCVEVFKSVIADFPAGELIADPHQERPDVVVKTAQARIGIEVTRILNPELRRNESECDQMIEAARELYEKRSLPHLHVSVHVTGEKVFTRSNRQRFASALADVVAANVPQANELQEVENDCNNPAAFPYEIDSILILRNRALTRNYWNAGKAGFILEDFTDRLQAVIDQKESRIGGYDTDCSELWLLIVAENDNPSAAFDPSPATLSHSYTSSFHRVFILNLFQRKVSDLKIK